MGFWVTTHVCRPAAPLAGALALALGLGACGRPGASASGGSRAEDSGASAGAAGAAASPASDAAVAGQGGRAAQGGADSVDFYPAAALAAMAGELARGTATGRTFGERPQLRYIEGRRATDGGVEIHERWADVVFVQAGRAQLLAGGRAQGARDTGGGELRGGSMVGGRARTLGPGDFFVIPAGVPHQYRIARGDTLRYLTIKVLRPGG